MKYIDTSAFVKYYGNADTEKGFDVICKQIDAAKAGDEVLVSSIFMVGEAVSAFDKWFRIKVISSDELNGILKRFLSDISAMTSDGVLILEPMHTYMISFTTALILKHHISFNDSIHLYTALSCRKLESFICSDKMLISAANAEGLKVFNPEDS